MEKPLLIFILILTGLLATNLAVGLISNGSVFYAKEVLSPSDSIAENQISVYDDKVVINVKDAYWAEYSDTNSMDPTIDREAKGIEIVPKSENELKVGDIVSYEMYNDDGLIVHRIVGIGSDNLGTYYTMKGDNNSSVDPGKVRFSQIKYKTIMIIY